MKRVDARQSGARAQSGMTHSQALPCSPDFWSPRKRRANLVKLYVRLWMMMECIARSRVARLVKVRQICGLLILHTIMQACKLQFVYWHGFLGTGERLINVSLLGFLTRPAQPAHFCAWLLVSFYVRQYPPLPFIPHSTFAWVDA